MKMHNIESRSVIGPSDILFGGVDVCTFQPGNFTGWGNVGFGVFDSPEVSLDKFSFSTIFVC